MRALFYWLMAIAYFMTIHTAHLYGQRMALASFADFTHRTVLRVAPVALVSFLIAASLIRYGILSEPYSLGILLHVESMCVLYTIVSVVFYGLERATRP
jgi:hypothetical protein